MYPVILYRRPGRRALINVYAPGHIKKDFESEVSIKKFKFDFLNLGTDKLTSFIRDYFK